jgi:lysophospholipid hydrolase
LEEKGIPIDMIGGTSIGSFVGGLYACEQSIEKVDPIARRWAEQGSSLWFYLMGTHISPSLSLPSFLTNFLPADLTFPITSYFNGYNFTRALRKVFGMKKIEDFWINYYCVTTDLTSHDERVHVNGTAYRYC